MQQIDEEDEEPRGMDLVVTFGKDETLTREIRDAYFESFDHLKATLKNQFSLEDDFCVKFVHEDGRSQEVSGMNWEQLKEQTKLKLEIELLNVPESGNYSEEEFEEEAPVAPVNEEEVRQRFQELKYIL